MIGRYIHNSPLIATYHDRNVIIRHVKANIFTLYEYMQKYGNNLNMTYIPNRAEMEKLIYRRWNVGETMKYVTIKTSLLTIKFGDQKSYDHYIDYYTDHRITSDFNILHTIGHHSTQYEMIITPSKIHKNENI